MSLVKYINVCLTMLLCATAMAQPLQKELTDTFYYDAKWNISTPKQAQVYRIPVTKTGDKYTVQYYYYSNHQLFYKADVIPGMLKNAPSIEPAVAVYDGVVTYYSVEGLKTSEEHYTSGRVTGDWKEFYANTGNLKTVTSYEDVSNQYVVNYYEDGVLKQSEGAMTGILKSGKMVFKRDGKWQYYNRSEGNVSAVVTFSAGDLDGDVRFFDSVTGNIVLKGKYSLALKSGQWTYYNPSTKQRTAIINFERGQPNGELFVFYNSGNLKQTGVYSQGKRNGLWSGLYDCADKRIQWQADYKKDRAQIVYYDSANNDREIRKGSLYVYQRVGLWLEYHAENGQLKSKETYNNNLLEGMVVSYDKSGVVTSEQTYRNGTKNGKSTYYFAGTKDVWTTATYFDDDIQKLQINYPSGHVKRVVDEMKFGDGRSICYSEDGAKEYCEPIETEAEFNGDVTTYIGSNLKYPEEARLLRMEGQVKVAFTINPDGSIRNPYIVEGFDSRCDEEALRLVAQMPAWKPASIDNTPVSTNMILPIVFAIRSSDMHAQLQIEKDAFEKVKN